MDGLVLRIFASIAGLEDRVAALVHPLAASDALVAGRHRRFMLPRLLLAGIGLAALPLHLAAAGPLAGPAMLAELSAMLALCAVLVVSMTRRMGLARLISAMATAGLLAAAILSIASGRPSFVEAAIAFAALLGSATLALAEWRERGGHARPALPDPSLAAIAAIVDPLVWQDRTGRVLRASAEADRLLGRRLAGTGFLDGVQVADRPAYLKALADSAASGETVAVDIRLNSRGADGRIHVVATRIAVRPVAGTEQIVASIRDRSHDERTSAEIDSLRRDLASASEVKGRFLATVSHELRTPLNAIIGFAEILAGDTLAQTDVERRREYAGIVHGSGQHLLEIVNTLLDVSRIEAGSFPIAQEGLDARVVGLDCCDLMRLKAGEAGVALVRDMAPDLPRLVADRRALKQIVLNLLSNAVKFTPAGGSVTLSMRRKGPDLVLCVRDTGIGIAEEDLSRLGSPFFQARSSYDRAYEGTGLGLSVVRGLVGLHRGHIAIDTAPGQGTSITVTLPLGGTPTGTSAPEPAAIESAARRGSVVRLVAQPEQMKKSA